jgi:hypothetical protein
VEEPRPYNEWRSDPNGRWRDAFHTFGHLLLSHARDGAIARLPASTSNEDRALAQQSATDALYNLMMILDGVAGAKADDHHSIEFALIARVRKRDDASPVVEQFELAPDGEESACMGFHLWTAGEYRE